MRLTTAAARRVRYAAPRGIPTPEEALMNELTQELPDVRRWPKAHREAIRELCEQGWTARPASSGSLTMTPPDGSPSKRVSDKTDLKELQSWKRRVERGTSVQPATVIDLTESEPAMTKTARAARRATELNLGRDDSDAQRNTDALARAFAELPPEEHQAFLMALIKQAAEQSGFTRSEAALLSYFVPVIDQWRKDAEYVANAADRDATELTKLYEQERDAALAERDALQARLDQHDEQLAAARRQIGNLQEAVHQQEVRADTAEGKLKQLRSALDL